MDTEKPAENTGEVLIEAASVSFEKNSEIGAEALMKICKYLLSVFTFCRYVPV